MRYKMNKKTLKQKVILASNNAHKAQEIKDILGEFFDIITLKEAGLNNFEIIEDGETFEENAFKKAMAVYKETKIPTISDDSGLCVDYLGGKPGVYTARYAGENASDDENIEKLLHELDGVEFEKRSAHFVCVIAFVSDINPDKTEYFSGECNGYIMNEKQGNSGFGYDPVFYYPEFKCSFAQISEDKKNEVSHRAKALQMFHVKQKQKNI